MKFCIYEESKPCSDCNECNMCELEPNKICDNCCKCIEGDGQDYRELNIAEWRKSLSDAQKAGSNDFEYILDEQYKSRTLQKSGHNHIKYRFHRKP